jgi:hypothetical protein
MTNSPEERIQSFSLIEKVLERLETRSNLGKLADTIGKTYSVETKNQYLTEEAGATFCFSEAGNGYLSTKAFACDNSFKCYKSGQSFMCNGGNSYTGACEEANIYNNCGGVTNGFECNNETPFLCNETTLFDCPTFKCGVPNNGTQESFTCNSEGDFNCAGQNTCIDDFKCTAGHIHLCINSFACDDKYDCAGGTECDNNPKAIYYCSETPGQPAYGDSGDEKPGDFQCGQIVTLPTGFDCKKNFNCVAKSDFMCEKGADFKCMNFSCKSGAEIMSYVCRTKFECKSTPPYQCNQDGSPFKCDPGSTKNYDCDRNASYSRCPTDLKKECSNKYKCSTPNDCVAPDFKCNQTGTTPVYDCSKNTPPYTPEP